MRLDMKKVLTSVALFGLTAAAMAADVPSRKIASSSSSSSGRVGSGIHVDGLLRRHQAGYGSDRNNSNNCFNGCGFGDSGLAVPTLTADFALGALAPVVPASGFPVGFGGLNSNQRNRDGFVGGGQIG